MNVIDDEVWDITYELFSKNETIQEFLQELVKHFEIPEEDNELIFERANQFGYQKIYKRTDGVIRVTKPDTKDEDLEDIDLSFPVTKDALSLPAIEWDGYKYQFIGVQGRFFGNESDYMC